jgi:hypothetical protein
MNWLSILDDVLTLVLAGCMVVVLWNCCIKVLLDFAGCDD